MQVFFALVILTVSWSFCLGLMRAQLRPTSAWQKAGIGALRRNRFATSRPLPSRWALWASIADDPTNRRFNKNGNT